MEDERARLSSNSRGSYGSKELVYESDAEGRNTRSLDIEKHLANVSLKAENEELKEQLSQLNMELRDQESNKRYLKRDQQIETKLLRDEERRKAHAMVTEVRQKLYREKQQEMSELRDRLHKEKEKEIAYIVKQKDEEFRKAQHNWSKEKEDLIPKFRAQFAREMREEAQKSYQKQVRKFEVSVEELKEQKKQVEESYKLAHEADKRKAEQIRRIHSEHENELTKLKRSSWQEGRKQMAEIRQLTNIIHQLEKKLGVESGHYIRLQMEKEHLRDKLDRVKGSELPGRRSPLFWKSDSSSDQLSFSFPNSDDSNNLWFQLKQHISTIAQLKQNLKDKDRRIDLLKQKLLKIKGRSHERGLMHRSMDDILSYGTSADRDDCISPQFGYSTGSSDTSSINEDSVWSDENLETEIIRKLRKELLNLEKAHSLLQAQTESNVDAKRNEMEKEQLQTDLIEAQMRIDELNKELVEAHDRNELLEFQLQESLHGDEGQEQCETIFNIPTLCFDYQFSDDELECSAEEIKAKLEDLENEKKSLLSRDEQLALLQAKLLIENICKGQFDQTSSSEEDSVHVSERHDVIASEKSRVIDSFTSDVGVQCKLVEVKYETVGRIEELRIILEGRTFKEVVVGIESAVQCELLETEKSLDDQSIEVADENLEKCTFRKVVQPYDISALTDASLFNEEVENAFNVVKSSEGFSEGTDVMGMEEACFKMPEPSRSEIAVQCSIMDLKADGYGKLETRDIAVLTDFSEVLNELNRNEMDPVVQCSFMEMKMFSELDDVLSKNNTTSGVTCNDVALQTDFSGFDGQPGKETNTGIQCSILRLVPGNARGGEILEIVDENSRILCFRKVVTARNFAAQTDFSEPNVDLVQNEILEMNTCDDKVIKNFDDSSVSLRFKNVLDSRHGRVESDVGEMDDCTGSSLRKRETVAPSNEDSEKHFGFHSGNIETVESAVQCDIRSLDSEETAQILLNSKMIESRDSDPQIDFVEFRILDDYSKKEDVLELDEEDVNEKQDGERSEKCMVGGNSWKDFIDESELRDAVLLDCVVYEKDEVLVVICESSRRYYKEKSSYNSFEEASKPVQPFNSSDDILEDGDPTRVFHEDSASNGGGLTTTPQVRASEVNLRSEVSIQCYIPMFPASKPKTVDAYVQCEGTDARSYANHSQEVEQSVIFSWNRDKTTQTGLQGEGDLCSSGEGLDTDLSLLDPIDFAQTLSISSPVENQSSDKMRNFTTQCPDFNNESSPKDLSCMHCGHAKVTCVNAAVQCEFVELLSLGNSVLETSGISEISSVLQEGQGESLIKEVMELAKECSQNDALIDQHLAEVVISQGMYGGFQDDEDVDSDDVIAVDIGVQCNVIPVPQVCDKQTQCVSEETVTDLNREQKHTDVGTQFVSENCDVSLQCSLLNFSETNDEGSQWNESSEIYAYDAEDSVLDNIVATAETWDKKGQCMSDQKENEEFASFEQEDMTSSEGHLEILENKDEVVYRDLYSEISNSNVHEGMFEDDDERISLNCSNTGNSKNSYGEMLFEDERKHGWKECKDADTQYDYYEYVQNVDKVIQCNLLDGGKHFGVSLENGECNQDISLCEDDSGPRMETLVSSTCRKISLSQDIQYEASSEGGKRVDRKCLTEKEIPGETMFELTSLKLKNEQLRQQVVELKIQLKRERDEEELDNAEKRDNRQQRRRSSGGKSVTFSLSKNLEFETTVKPTRKEVSEENSFLQDNSYYSAYSEETTIIAEEEVVRPLQIDLDNVFNEMEAKPSGLVLHVQLPPQRVQSTSVSDSDDSEDCNLKPAELELRAPAKETTVTRTFKDEALRILDESLQAFDGKAQENDSIGNEDRHGQSLYRNNLLNGQQLGNSYQDEFGVEGSFEQDFPLPPIPDSFPSVSDYPTPNRDSPLPIPDSSPPIPDSPPPISDSPPPIPDRPPPALPSQSPPGEFENNLDEDIEAILAEVGDGIVNPAGVRSTLDHEVQAILESNSSSVTSEPETVISMDSLSVDQSERIVTSPRDTSDVLNDVTDMLRSTDHDDVISETAVDSSVEALLNSASNLGHGGFSSEKVASMEMHSNVESKSSERHVFFHLQDSLSDLSSVSADDDQRIRHRPPPVLPKPKHRSSSMSLSLGELPRVPVQNKDNRQQPQPNSLAAQRDMVDGHFPPPGLVPKRASEFSLGELDLLKEKIIFLERQLKNKENLLQSVRAEAMEIETNACIQKKEQDLKMMDESVRFLKLENQKKEKELIAKIGELSKCNFELEQWKSECTSSEKQRKKLEENMNLLQTQLNNLQAIEVRFHELKCQYSTLGDQNCELQEQVNRLHRADKEFVELERTISNLQTKLKEMEDVKRERGELCKQLKVVKNQKDDLVNKGRKIETERNDFLMNNKLMEQQKENLEARNKALQRTNDTFKTKISSLEKEFRDCQRRLFDAQRERDEGSSQLRKLEAERNELRKRVNELLECKSEMKQSQSKCHDLDREVNFLHAQCKNLEVERTKLSTELEKCLKERNRLEGRAAELDQLSRNNEKLEEKFHTLKLKIAELTSQRDDAEVQLPTLKAKVALLKKACKEKDEQLAEIKEEIQELKHSVATSGLDDLSKIRTYGFSSPDNFVKFVGISDPNNNTVSSKMPKKGVKYVVLFDYDPSRLSTTGHPENELKLSEGDVITVYGEMDVNGYYMAELDGAKGLVPSLYIEEMDEYDVRKVTKQRQVSDKNPSKKPSIPLSPPKKSTIPLKTSTTPFEPVKRPFVALQNYNPFTSSTSSRPDLEIPLTAGEIVTVVGDVDANGYYTVELGGRLAIIPSNLVKPSSPPLMRPSKLNYSGSLQQTEKAPYVPYVPLVQNASSISAVNGFSDSIPSHSSMGPRSKTVEFSQTPSSSRRGAEHAVRQRSVETLRNTENYQIAANNRETSASKLTSSQSGLPAAPKNLRVLRCVNKDALLLGWITPEVDEMGRNNGHVIKGYKILVNDQPKLDVDSPYMAKALVEKLDLSRPMELAIQTVAENWLCSEKSSTHLNDALRTETTSVSTEGLSSQDDGSPYRTFVALYSYDPIKNSPNPNPTSELEFQEGDIIRILDTSRPDGFYIGQIGGNEGLVPSNFLEEIAVAHRPKSMMLQKHGEEQEVRDLNSSVRSTTSSLASKKAKVMVALYDYDASTQSPNDVPSRELSFRKGQIIRVYGSLRSDGFFEGDINGEKGLVPSSFLKPCKRRSKLPSSTNDYSSLPRRVQFVNQKYVGHNSNGYV